MSLSKGLIDFIRQPEIEQLLARNDFDKIYEKISYDNRVRVDEVTRLFILAGVDFLPYLSKIPAYCYHDLGIQQINIPGNCTRIGFSAFLNCGRLEEASLEDGVEEIGPFAFQNCVSLRTATFPETLKVLESAAFDTCTSLEDISIPDTVNSLGLAICRNCTGLRSAKLPAGVHTIPFRTFSGCIQLETVFIDVSYRQIDSCAFDGCNALTTIHYSGSMAAWKLIDIKNHENSTLYLCTVKCSDGDLEWGGSKEGWVQVT